MTFSKKKLPKSQIVIEVQLTPEEVARNRPEAIASLAKNLRLEGFRLGHIPAAIAERHLGEAVVFEEAARLAIAKAYGSIVQLENLDVIGEPEVRVLKLAPGNDLEFRIQVAVLLDVELPDYKKIAGQSARKEVAVEEKEVDEALDWLQKSRKTPAESPEGIQAGPPPATTSSDVGGGGKDQEEISLDDNFAKSVGNFGSLAELRASIHEGLRHEKEMRERERLRQEIIEKIAERSKLEVPEILVEREKQVLISQIKQGVAQALQMSFEEYLLRAGKTEQEVFDSFASDAEQRVKRFLVLRQVAKIEGIGPTAQEIEQEAQTILRHYQEARKGGQELDGQRLREYTEGVLRHEKTLQFLEQFAKT